MNNFNGIGRIVNNLELRTTSNNNSVCQFTIAINEGYGDKERTNFIDCVAWNKRAEMICKYCDKGVKVAVTGKLQTYSYEKDGKKIKTTKVLVNEIQFIEKLKNEVVNDTPQEETDPFEEFGKEISDEELPF